MILKHNISFALSALILTASCDLPKTIEITSDKLDDLNYIAKQINQTFKNDDIQNIKRITENCNIGIESQINNYKTQISTQYKYFQSIENNKDIKTLKEKISLKQKANRESKKIMEKQLKTIAISDTFMVTLEDISPFDSVKKLQKKAEDAIFAKAVENLSDIYLETTTQITNNTVKDIIKQNISGKVTIDNMYLSKIDRANKLFFYMAKAKVLPLEEKIKGSSTGSNITAYQINRYKNQEKVPRKYKQDVENILEKYYTSIQNQNDLAQTSQNDIIATYENTIEDNNYEIRRIQKEIKRTENKLAKMYQKVGVVCNGDFVNCNDTAQKKIISKVESFNNNIIATKNGELIYKTSYVETESDNPQKGIAKQVNSVVKQTVQTYSKVQSLNMDTVVVNNKIVKDSKNSKQQFYRELDKFYIYPVPATGNGFNIVVVNKFKIKENDTSSSYNTANSYNSSNSYIVNSNSIDKGDHIIPAMIKIKSGSFMMGSDDGDSDEKPVHKVTIPNDFYIGKYEVTFKEYDKFCEDTGRSKPKDRGWGRGDHPVIYVSWNDAKAYAKWLSKKTGKNYRLPTESEWEYVARAGTATKYSFGNSSNDLNSYAWYDKNSYDKGSSHPDYGTHKVGTKQPNPWGIYDIHGNVWEWCDDWYIDNYNFTPRDGTAYNNKKDYKVLRGGSWFSTADFLRSAYRSRDSADDASDYFGFRLVLSG